MLKLVDYDGYYAKVRVRPNDGGERLLRNTQYYIDYNGLKSIENIASENGIINDEIFNI